MRLAKLIPKSIRVECAKLFFEDAGQALSVENCYQLKLVEALNGKVDDLDYRLNEMKLFSDIIGDTRKTLIDLNFWKDECKKLAWELEFYDQDLWERDERFTCTEREKYNTLRAKRALTAHRERVAERSGNVSR